MVNPGSGYELNALVKTFNQSLYRRGARLTKEVQQGSDGFPAITSSTNVYTHPEVSSCVV
jgi:hypothetical protein